MIMKLWINTLYRQQLSTDTALKDIAPGLQKDYFDKCSFLLTSSYFKFKFLKSLSLNFMWI